MKSKEKREAMDAYFKKAKRRTQEIKDSLVRGATFYDKDKISERIYRMILYAAGSAAWYDDRQHRLLNIGLALVTASVALAILGATILPYPPDLPTLTIIFGLLAISCIFGTGLSLVYYYNRHLAPRYPYREVVDIRSWHFIYTLPSPSKDTLSKNFDRAREQIEEIIKDYKVFMSRSLEYSADQHRLIEEDLEQVFILQLLQKYRLQAVRTMSTILCYGISIGGILIIVAIASYVCCSH